MAPISLNDTVNAVASSIASSIPAAPNDAPVSASPFAAPSRDGTIPPQPIDPTAERRLGNVGAVEVDSPNLTYTDEALFARYTFHSAQVDKVATPEGNIKYKTTPVEKLLEFRTERKVPKTGCVAAFFSFFLFFHLG